MSETKSCQIYDDIVSDYSAIKTNPFKTNYEKPAFWKALGDVKDKNVLDLACGSGYYTSSLKQIGANKVVGVDISKGMVEDARQQQKGAGVQYEVGDAANYMYNMK